jgi:hypothetical protein
MATEYTGGLRLQTRPEVRTIETEDANLQAGDEPHLKEPQFCAAIMELPATSRRAIARGSPGRLESQPLSSALAASSAPRQWPGLR